LMFDVRCSMFDVRVVAAAAAGPRCSMFEPVAN